MVGMREEDVRTLLRHMCLHVMTGILKWSRSGDDDGTYV
jgi:hypothetical protein